MTQTLSLESLQNPSKKSLFILDIDSTLVTTHQRNQNIIDDWVRHFAKDYPEDSQALTGAFCQYGDYGYHNALERIQFKEQKTGAMDHFHQFWRENFFSNKYLHADLAVRGAVHWVQDLEEKGVDFVYLTARHKETMWEGTLSSMDQLGFPMSEDILFLKEDLTVPDAVYKSNKITEILKTTDKNLCLIDNEPLVLHQVLKDHPQVQLVWFDSTHSGKKQAPEGVLAIQDFQFS
jgi:hypothetical protein